MNLTDCLPWSERQHLLLKEIIPWVQVQFFPEAYPEVKSGTTADLYTKEADLLALAVTEDLFQVPGKFLPSHAQVIAN